MKTLPTFLIIGFLAMTAWGQDVLPVAGLGIADTPEQAFETLQSAVVAGDHVLIISCYALTDGQAEAYESMLDLVDAMAVLEAKAVTVLGDDASEMDAFANPYRELAGVSIDDCTLVEDGDTATFTLPSGEELDLVKSDAWSFTEEQMPTDAGELETAMSIIQAMTGVFEDAMDDVDAEGMTAEKLAEILDEGTTNAVMERMAADTDMPDPVDQPDAPAVDDASGVEEELVASTPQQAYQRFQVALESNDRDAILACFELNDEGTEAFNTLFDFRDAINGFDAEVTRVFGEDADAELGFEDAFDGVIDNAVTTCTFTEDGDTAVCIDADGDDHQMVKVDGAWKFTADDMPLGDPEFEKSLEMLESVTEVLDDMTAEAGKEGMTLDQLQAVYMQRMMAMAAEAEATPAPQELPDLSDQLVGGELFFVAEGLVASTPQEAFESFQAALLAGDYALMADHMGLAESQKVMFDSAMAFSDAGAAFDAKVREVFGDEAADGFEITDLFEELTTVTAEDCTFDVDGDAAMLTTPSGEEFPLTQIDGVWLFSDASNTMPTDAEEIAEMVEVMELMTAVYEGMLSEVDAEGMTVELLESTLEERLIGVMMAMMEAEMAAEADGPQVAPLSDRDSVTGDAGDLPVADTPEQAVKNLGAAMEAMDRDAFLASFNTDDTQTKVLGATFDMMVAIMDYQAEITSVFGDDAAAAGMFGSSNPFAELQNAAAAAANPDVVTNDDGTASWVSDSEVPSDLVQVDGVWKFSLDDEGMPSDATDAAEVTQMVSMIETMTSVTESMIDEVGKEGMTVAQLDELMQQRMMTVMMMMMQQQQMQQPAEQPVEDAPVEALPVDMMPME